MQSGLQIAYLKEIELQSGIIARAATRLEIESQSAERDAVEIWMHIQTILVSAGNISLLLWGENDEERLWLRRCLEIESSTPFQRRRGAPLRFDGRVDEWEATRADNGFVTFEGRQIGDPDSHASEQEWFQRYDATTGVVNFWHFSIGLPPIVDEAKRIQPLAREFSLR